MMMRKKELEALKDVRVDSEYLWGEFNKGTLSRITCSDRGLLVKSPVILGDTEAGIKECVATLNKPIFIQKELTRQMVADTMFRISTQMKFVENTLTEFTDSLILAEFHAGTYDLKNAVWQDPNDWNDYIVRKRNRKSALKPLVQLSERVNKEPINHVLIHEAIGTCHSDFPPRIAYITGDTRGHILGYILWREADENEYDEKKESNVLDLGVAQRLSNPTSAVAQLLIRASHTAIDPIKKRTLTLSERVLSSPISSY